MMDTYSKTIIEHLYILVKYQSWDLNDIKKRTNYLCYPIKTVLFNFESLKKINICKKTFTIINDSDKKIVSEMFRFSNGPFYFEKPTHIYINDYNSFLNLKIVCKNKNNFEIFEN
jgi:hypothetical protein